VVRDANYLGKTGMTVTSLDDLFLRELRETHKAETLILRALPELAQIDSSRAARLDAYAAQARERVKRLEQICKLDIAEYATEPSALGVLAKIDDYIASMGNHEVVSAVVHLEFMAAWHYLLARYAMLSACGNQLRKSEWAEFADKALEEQRAFLSQTPNVHAERRQGDLYRGTSMGERLTAMFDRKK
jgi:ferritin-like metal-binding protein YciE